MAVLWDFGVVWVRRSKLSSLDDAGKKHKIDVSN